MIFLVCPQKLTFTICWWCKSIRTFSFAQKCITRDMNLIQNWCNRNSIILSLLKTQFISLVTIPADFSLTLWQHAIKHNFIVKFLGLWLDSKLLWSNHIEKLSLRCSKILHILRYVCGSNLGCLWLNLLHLYKTLIRFRLDYGCQLYDFAS